jgi:hypothetical protein
VEGTAVPEARVKEDGHPCSNKHDIRFAGQGIVDPEAEAFSMES